MNSRCSDQGTVHGIIAFENYLIESPRAQQIDQYLSEARNVSRETFKALIAELRLLCPTTGLAVRNQVVLAARSELAKRLIGTHAYTGTINYGALGTGSTSVADANTQLATEVARVLVATTSRTDDQVTIDFYFSKSSTNGTYQEFGTFIDGTTSANTGLLFNRALTGG